jgi:hypothetical protein
MRAAGRSNHQDLVTKMKGYPFENVATAAVMRPKLPRSDREELRRVGDGRGQAVERRRIRWHVALDESATCFAALVRRVAMIGRTSRRVAVIVIVIVVCMNVTATDDRQELDLFAAGHDLDMLMMPAAADHCVQQ